MSLPADTDRPIFQQRIEPLQDEISCLSLKEKWQTGPVFDDALSVGKLQKSESKAGSLSIVRFVSRPVKASHEPDPYQCENILQPHIYIVITILPTVPCFIMLPNTFVASRHVKVSPITGWTSCFSTC
jgi:hypothetical protein